MVSIVSNELFPVCRVFIFVSLYTAIFAEPTLRTEVDTNEINNLGCSQDGDCLSVPTDCPDVCGCDRVYIYNETSGECVLNLKEVMKVVVYHYDTQDRDVIFDTGIAKNLRIDAEKVFKGIIVAAFLFITCAAVCLCTACLYCCRINYTDRILKNDVKALAKKLNRDYHLKKSSKKPVQPKSESCNVIVEDAGVFVV